MRMAPTLPRSTLEEMLESIKKTDDKQRDMPPALPQRPTSRARLPSSIRGRKSASSSSDKSRQSVDNHSKNSRPSKPGSNSESPGTSVGGSPPKSERSVDSGRIGNGNKPASPKSRAASSSNSPSGSVNVGRPSKDKDEAEVNSNGHKINNDHTVRNSTSGGRLSENGGSTPPTASSSNAAAASSRKWKDESLAGLKKVSTVATFVSYGCGITPQIWLSRSTRCGPIHHKMDCPASNMPFIFCEVGKESHCYGTLLFVH